MLNHENTPADPPPPAPQPVPPPVAPPPPPPAAPPPVAPPPPPPVPLSQSEEHTLAMLSHLSVLLNLVSGFLGVLVPLIIYLIYKPRSRYVAYQSLQAFLFQIVCWIGGWALVVLLGILGAIPIIGIVFWPLACLSVFIPLIPLVYGIVAGIKSNNGEDFKYPLVGDWVRGTYTAP